MSVVAGQPFTVTILDGYPLKGQVGARVEVPVTRAIASYFKVATLQPNTPAAGSDTWSVTMDPVVRPGDYLLVWMNALDQFEVPVPLSVISPGSVINQVQDFPTPDLAQVTPTVADVGAIERVRTTDRGGTLIGTFNSNTTPTDSAVSVYIADSVDTVLSQLPEQFPSKYYAAVKRAITLQAALWVESSDYPESNEPDSARKERMLTTLIRSLNERIRVDYQESYAPGEAAAQGPILV